MQRSRRHGPEFLRNIGHFDIHFFTHLHHSLFPVPGVVRYSFYLYVCMFDIKTIIWFVFTLLLMGFFAGIEMAFYSVNRLGIELRKKQGTTSGRLLGQFTESPVRFLGTTLIGFNIFLVFFSLQVSTVMRPAW